MTPEQMWNQYGGDGPYEAWAFGDDADTLAGLVLDGEKTATASAYALYALEDEPLPEPGAYSVVLDSRGEAVCVIRTTTVTVKPFSEVDAQFARKEGEGDRTLAYWRRVHKDFFAKEMEAVGLEFTEQMDVVLEEFVRLYPYNS